MQQNEQCIIVVTGHYGSGKSCFSVNLAKEIQARLKEKKSDLPVVLADLDIVNPYFRSADSEALLKVAGVDVITQQFANTNVDNPSIPGKLNLVFERKGISILDIGGDDSGAAVLGGISDKLKEYGFRHFNVVNFKRPQSENADTAYECIRDIETMARLPVTDLLNNTNLGEETYPEILSQSVGEAKKLAELLHLNNALSHSYVGEYPLPFDGDLFIMQNYTKRYF